MAAYICEILFECPHCLETIEVTKEVSEPDWIGDRAEDRTVEDELEITCVACDETEIATAVNRDGHVAVTLDRWPSTIVRVSRPYTTEEFFDPWMDITSSPTDVFMESVAEVKTVLERFGSVWSSNPVNRMIMAHYFGAFEALLSDSIINYVICDADALLRLVRSDSNLRATKVGLERIIFNSDLPRKLTHEYLREIVYHNFPRVEAIYKCAANINIWPGEKEKAILYAALPLRHDIVHRNGRDNDGNPRSHPDRVYLHTLLVALTTTVEHIESALRQAHVSYANDKILPP